MYYIFFHWFIYTSTWRMLQIKKTTTRSQGKLSRQDIRFLYIYLRSTIMNEPHTISIKCINHIL